MVETLLLIVIVLLGGFWTGNQLRERQLRNDIRKSMDRFAETALAMTDKHAADLAGQLDHIRAQVDFLAERVSELRLDQMAREDRDSVDFLADYTIDSEDR